MPIASTVNNAFRDTNIVFREYADDIMDVSVRRPVVYDFFCATAEDSAGALVIEHDVAEVFPTIREWLGERQFADILFAPVRALMKTYEKSHAFTRKEANSFTGARILRLLMNWIGAREWDYDKIVHDATFAGNTGPVGYDGVPIWSASHPRGLNGAVQSNTSATPYSAAQHRAIVIAGSSLVDPNGEPLGIGYDTIMVGPALVDLAREITESKIGTRYAAVNAAGAEATSGVVAVATVPNARGVQVFTGGPMRVIVNPRFVGALAQKYLFLDTSKGVTPMVLYPGESFMAALTDPWMQPVFTNDSYQYGVTLDLALVPAAWQVGFFGGA